MSEELISWMSWQRFEPQTFLVYVANVGLNYVLLIMIFNCLRLQLYYFMCVI